VLLAFAAKKRAEAAPGVGKNTDMVVIGPGLGTNLKVEDKHIKELERIYNRSRHSTEKAVKQAQKETKKFVEEVREEYRLRALKESTEKQSTPLEGEEPQEAIGAEESTKSQGSKSEEQT